MANTYLTRQISSAGTNRTKATISLWVKIGASIGSDQRFFSYENTSVSNNVTVFKFVGLAGGSMGIQFADQTGGSNNAKFDGTRALRDPSAWYHFVVKADTTQLTNTDRLKIYINGELQTSTHGSYTYPSQNSTLNFGHNANAYIDIGRWRGSNNQYFDGSMTHFHYTDGYAYDASTFGSTDSVTGEWKINTSPSITMGTNGFTILKDGNTITDQSSNSNNFTLGGGTLTKTECCPSNVFATWNATDRWLGNTAGNTDFLANGNTYFRTTSDSQKALVRSSIGVTSGKYYCEMKITQIERAWVGICNRQVFTTSSEWWTTSNNGGFFWYGNGSAIYASINQTTGNYGGFANNDIVMMALDMDNYAWYLGKNGTWLNSGNPESGASKTGSVTEETHFGTADLTNYEEVFFMAGEPSAAGIGQVEANFGNGYFGTTAVASAGTNASGIGIFEYDVPTGYTALSTKGLNL